MNLVPPPRLIPVLLVVLLITSIGVLATSVADVGQPGAEADRTITGSIVVDGPPRNLDEDVQVRIDAGPRDSFAVTEDGTLRVENEAAVTTSELTFAEGGRGGHYEIGLSGGTDHYVIRLTVANRTEWVIIPSAGALVFEPDQGEAKVNAKLIYEDRYYGDWEISDADGDPIRELNNPTVSNDSRAGGSTSGGPLSEFVGYGEPPSEDPNVWELGMGSSSESEETVWIDWGVLGLHTIAGLGLVIALIVGVAAVYVRSGTPTFDPEEHEVHEPPSTENIAAVAGELADRIENESVHANEVYRAWDAMVRTLDVADPDPVTPREFEHHAIAGGIDPDHAAELTQLFQAVRYGGEPPAAHEDRAVAVLRRIEETYGSEEE